MDTNKRRLAIVGTGHRGAGTWGSDAPAAAADEVELVGLCDTNPARAMSVLTGVATTRSAETGRPVDILALLDAD